MSNVAVKKAQANKEQGLTVFQPASNMLAQLTDLGVTIETMSINLPSNLNLKQCSGVMQSVTEFKDKFDGTYRWVVGDMVVYAQDKFGDNKYSQLLTYVKMDAGDARNCAWVSRQIPPSYRVNGLSWSHHREVAIEQIPDIDTKHSILLEALQNNMSVSQLRIYVESKFKKKSATPPQSTPVSPPTASASIPVPGSYSVTSFQAVTKWIEHVGSQPEIQWCIEALIAKITDLGFLATATLLLDARTEALGKEIGMHGIPSINAEDDDENPAKSAIEALSSIGIDVNEADDQDDLIETDEDGVIINHEQASNEPTYVSIAEMDPGADAGTDPQDEVIDPWNNSSNI